MQNNIVLKEIFTSIQGEGPYIGVKQFFMRFTKCNLKCKYCDTNFFSDLKEYSVENLLNIVNEDKSIHSISLTGGEPLLEVEFLQSFLPLVSQKIYLETNGTLYKNLEKIINYIDIISMDIKLNSVSDNGDLFKLHEEFIKIAVKYSKEIFCKIVFNEKISDEEISQSIKLAKENNLLLILQPEWNSINKIELNKIFNLFVEKYSNVRLIPQVHKFLNLQ